MTQKSTNDIINGADFSFGFAILRGGVRTRESKSKTLMSTKLMKHFIIKFTPVITLKRFDFEFKLGKNKGIEIHKHIIYLRFAK